MILKMQKCYFSSSSANIGNRLTSITYFDRKGREKKFIRFFDNAEVKTRIVSTKRYLFNIIIVETMYDKFTNRDWMFVLKSLKFKTPNKIFGIKIPSIEICHDFVMKSNRFLKLNKWGNITKEKYDSNYGTKYKYIVTGEYDENGKILRTIRKIHNTKNTKEIITEFIEKGDNYEFTTSDGESGTVNKDLELIYSIKFTKTSSFEYKNEYDEHGNIILSTDIENGIDKYGNHYTEKTIQSYKNIYWED